jgi:hypothetical protein
MVGNVVDFIGISLSGPRYAEDHSHKLPLKVVSGRTRRSPIGRTTSVLINTTAEYTRDMETPSGDESSRRAVMGPNSGI